MQILSWNIIGINSNSKQRINPQEFQLDKFNSSPNFLSVESFMILESIIKGLLTNVYGLNIVTQKLNILNQLSSMGQNMIR